jgi:xylitol oxidase
MRSNRSNWAGNYTYDATAFHYPETVEQVQQLARRTDKLKVLGSGHSFNSIADTPGDMVSLERLERVLVLDRRRRKVTVDGGLRYGDLCGELHHAGYALHNLASLPHISIAGACATATHGSGDLNGNLATAVSALEFVAADGTLVALSRDQDGEVFNGVVVGLGGLGVVTKLTLDIVPAFDMRQNVYENLPLAQLDKHFEAIAASAYSVSFFTDWQSERINQVWLKRRITDGASSEVQPQLFGATPAPTHKHPIGGLSAEACTEQMGIAGPWFARLPHFRMEFTPSSGDELQSEYLVPRRHAVEAIHAIDRMREQIAPLLQVSEIRTVAADNLWMSPFYREAGVGIHFTWKKDLVSVGQLLPLIEEALEPFDARPHWGKLFTMPPARLQSFYPKLPDFRRLLRDIDPNGKFSNPFLDTYIFQAC